MPPVFESIFSEIQTAYLNKLYYLAISVTLTIPDVCAGAELDLTITNVKKKHYIDWCERYLAPQYVTLTAEDFYHLRGGIIHTGAFGHRDKRFDRVIFTAPSMPIRGHDQPFPKNNVGGGKFEDAIMLDVAALVATMTRAVEAWWADKQNEPNVQHNIERIVQWRPNGAGPIHGAAVIS